MATVRERISNGDYNNKLPYGDKNKNGLLTDESRKERQSYREEERALIIKFHNDLIAENGMLDHPKESLVWQKAWDDGHSSGLIEVMQIYEELVEIAK